MTTTLETSLRELHKKAEWEYLRQIPLDDKKSLFSSLHNSCERSKYGLTFIIRSGWYGVPMDEAYHHVNGAVVISSQARCYPKHPDTMCIYGSRKQRESARRSIEHFSAVHGIQLVEFTEEEFYKYSGELQ